MLERAAEDRSRIDGQLRKRAVLDLLVGDEAASRVEEENAEPFVGKRTHRGDQIFAQRRREGIDRARGHPRSE